MAHSDSRWSTVRPAYGAGIILKPLEERRLLVDLSLEGTFGGHASNTFTVGAGWEF